MIIFLDIDGVLNTHEQNQLWIRSLARCHSIDRNCMENLNQIIVATGSHCVLTSSWRYQIGGLRPLHPREEDRGSLKSFEFMLRTHGFPEGRLVNFPCRDEEIVGRGNQIQHYLDSISNVLPYVVLYDLSPELESMNNHPLVTTNCHIGLTDTDAERAIHLLEIQRLQPWKTLQQRL